MSFKSTGYAKAKTVSHGDLRDDRPPYGRGGRASKDGLAACRLANAMAHHKPAFKELVLSRNS
ncbi:hypothetical protein [Shewanella sp. W3-18-1]|uniref:hypothetical protein n=1 Tax=Shewanella sp. (strain W3-18-1) TaxID=351745 RepID=UPI00031121C0|nr:hypothetical protein [Shewanella sp. W3-18-1]